MSVRNDKLTISNVAIIHNISGGTYYDTHLFPYGRGPSSTREYIRQGSVLLREISLTGVGGRFEYKYTVLVHF